MSIAHKMLPFKGRATRDGRPYMFYLHVFFCFGGNAPCAAIGRTRPIRGYPLCGASIAGPATPRWRLRRTGGSRTAPTGCTLFCTGVACYALPGAGEHSSPLHFLWGRRGNQDGRPALHTPIGVNLFCEHYCFEPIRYSQVSLIAKMHLKFVGKVRSLCTRALAPPGSPYIRLDSAIPVYACVRVPAGTLCE